MRKVALVMLLTAMFCVLQPSHSSVANVELGKFDKVEWYLTFSEKFMQHPSEVLKLKSKVEKLKDKYHLLYKDEADLIETLTLVTAYADKTFTPYDLAPLIGVESKFKRTARSNVGAKGLVQLMDEWQKELPYLKDPYDKQQAIRACVDILHIKKGKNGSKNKAFERYNGAGPEARKYVREIRKFRRDLLKA